MSNKHSFNTKFYLKHAWHKYFLGWFIPTAFFLLCSLFQGTLDLLFALVVPAFFLLCAFLVAANRFRHWKTAFVEVQGNTLYFYRVLKSGWDIGTFVFEDRLTIVDNITAINVSKNYINLFGNVQTRKNNGAISVKGEQNIHIPRYFHNEEQLINDIYSLANQAEAHREV